VQRFCEFKHCLPSRRGLSDFMTSSSLCFLGFLGPGLSNTRDSSGNAELEKFDVAIHEGSKWMDLLKRLAAKLRWAGQGGGAAN
jgi:hypothetical protein